MADALSDAQTLFSEALDALSDQRRQVEEDLEFSDPSNPQQWDWDEIQRRENDPGGARPCLVYDQLGQYVSNVAGLVEQRPPGMHALPVDGGSDRRVAEQIDGHFRHIEHVSRAPQHYARSLTSGARAGAGYLIVRPEYTNRALGYQEPRISSEGDPLRVVFDPWSIELDGSDADFAFLLTPLSERAFKRRFPKAEPVSFHDGNYTQDDSRRSIMVVEAWQADDVTKQMVQFIGLDGDEISLPADQFEQVLAQGRVAQVLGERSEKCRRVMWRRMSGAEVLEESEYPADGVGIVPVYGYVGFADGRMTYCGIPRRARSAQQAYNFHKSEERAYILNAPKSPWIVAGAAVGEYKEIWDRASVEQRAWLPWNHRDDDGTPIPPPQRMPVAVNLQNHIQGAQEALRDIQAAIGMYAANLGAPSNETSGIAIEQRKQQGEASTAHFQSHLAASVSRVGQLCLQMLPRLVDTKRQLRILGMDGTASSVTVDPSQPQGVVETEAGLIINPNVGKYDVRVVVGAAYSTQRTQAQEAFTEMMRANPGMSPAVAPLWARTLDVPDADKLAQVLTAMAPPQVQAILSPEKQGPTTEQLQAQLAQMQQALQEAVQIAQQTQVEAEAAKAEAEKARAEAEAISVNAQVNMGKLQVDAFNAETARLKAIADAERQALEAHQKAQEAARAQMQPAMPPEPAQPPAPAAEPIDFAGLIAGLSKAMNPPKRKVMQIAAPSGQIYTGEMVESADIEEPMSNGNESY